MVLAGAVSVQAGAGIASRLFAEIPPAAVTALRLWGATLIMVVLAGRGTSRELTGLVRRRAWGDALVSGSFGIGLGLMNFAIYQAFARIPLGIAVTTEFLGPLAVALVGALRGGAPRGGAYGGKLSRAAASEGRASEDLRASQAGPILTAPSPRRRGVWGGGFYPPGVWVLLAAGGVLLLARGSGGHLNRAGVAWGLAAAAGWAAYILLSKAAGQRMAGASGLVVAMAVAAAGVTAPGVVAGGTAMFRPRFLGAGLAIGLLSSVVPYWLELEALRRVPARVFGVWMSLQPAVAALIGLVMLGQRLSVAEWLGICCVVAASAGAARASTASRGGTA
jgi:inner membrane transporter RhtA